MKTDNNLTLEEYYAHTTNFDIQFKERTVFRTGHYHFNRTPGQQTKKN